MKPQRLAHLCAGFLCGAFVLSTGAQAQPGQAATQPEVTPADAPRPEARVELAVGQTDNLNHDELELRSDITTLGLGFAARSDASRLEGAIAGDVKLMKYGAEGLEDDDEVMGSIDGAVELGIVPERFVWDFGLGFGQVRTDPKAAVGPLNRQRTTVASTGPKVMWPLGARHTIEAAASVSDRKFATTEALDSRLTTTRLAIARALDAVTSVGLRLERSENEFDMQPDTYEFKILSADYRRELASGQALLIVGRGEVDIGGVSESTSVSRLAWDRAVGTRSRLEIWGGRELTDAGNLFAGGGAPGGQADLSGLAAVAQTTDGRLRDVVLSSSPLRRQSFGVGFRVTGDRTTIATSVSAADDRFEIDPALDNESTSVELSVSRELGPRWQLRAAVTRWEQEFTATETESEDRSARLDVWRSIARGLRLGIALERNDRNSDFDPFDETLFLVSVGHDFRR